MKRIFALLAMLFLIISLIGCSAKESSHNEITEMIDQGYQLSMISIHDATLCVFLCDDNGNYQAALTDYTAQVEKDYEALDIFSGSYQDDLLYFCGSLKNLTIKGLNKYLPSQQQLAQFAGKKFNEIEAFGFEECGECLYEDSFDYIFSNGIYEITCTVVDNQLTKSISDTDYTERMAMAIGNVSFRGISSSILDHILQDQ